MMADFERWGQYPEGWDLETGAPGVGLFGNALQVWTLMQEAQPVSVADAARAFNVAPHRIVEAVDEHMWMLLVGPQDDYARLMIEHDGE